MKKRRARPLPGDEAVTPFLTGQRRTLLALDPSFTGTGWVVVDLSTGKIIAAGVITTKNAKATERLTGAQDNAQRGLKIRRAIAHVLATYKPVVVAQEGNGGSKSVKAAVGLARAQQACVDAIDEYLGAMPIMPTEAAVKKSVVGRHANVTKDDLEGAAKARWPGTPWAQLFKAAITGPTPPGEWENGYDAACVAHCVWDDPAVALARRIG